MIDSRAIIDPHADIADDVEIGPFCVIGPDVRIGRGTTVGPHTVIRGPTEIGQDNVIHSFASVGEGPQDLKYRGEPTRLEIGDRNTIREYVTLNRGSSHGLGITRIGNDNMFMAYSHVAHDCRVGDHTIFANCASLAGHVDIGDWAILGGFAGIHQFCRVGEHAFASMGSMVSKDVPPYVIVSGNYARSYGINRNGLKRRGFSVHTIRALHRTYMRMVRLRVTASDAPPDVLAMAEEYPEVRRFLDFLGESARGIVR